MWKMTVYQWLIICILLPKGGLLLKDVTLTIEPSIVRRQHHATLRCSYNLEGASLYYVKWYRGSYEFYRFTPSEQPTTKVFPFLGINVDVNKSNSTQAVLINIDFQLSGNFSCEVTTAEEPASTGTDIQSMLVIQLPDDPPKISVGSRPLDYGDILRANCSSSPSRPAAVLKFMLNNLTVARSEPLWSNQSSKVLWSDLSLELELTQAHFKHGRLILRCVAQILEIYHEESQLQLDSARDPVPEKVSAMDSSANTLAITQATIKNIIFCMILII